MEEWLRILATAVCSYLIGSLNFAIIVSKLAIKTDIRELGSGNAGSTNAYRTLGPRLAILVIAGDILKGLAAVAVGLLIMGNLGKIIAGAFAVLGHAFPAYFGFKGGKGVLTTASIMLMVDWRVALIAISVFVVLVVPTRYVSLGSMIAAACLPFIASFFYFGTPEFIPYISVTTLFSGIIIFLHRANIVRLIQKRESKFSFSRKPSDGGASNPKN
ncbi:glycerol-3-phosphate acyltransferase [Clostridia bacterium]|nr:glycerol-3-phosphate acyltransferase [Clostridia bacterium]